MAVKVLLPIKYIKDLRCLGCNRKIEIRTINRLLARKYKSTKYTCPNCKQEHFVDKKDDVIVLVKKEFEYLRKDGQFVGTKKEEELKKENKFLRLENANFKKLISEQRERIDELETTIEKFVND